MSWSLANLRSGGRPKPCGREDDPRAVTDDVAQVLGTRGKKETVNTGLREVLENRRRALALTRLRAAAEDGAFDLDPLQDKKSYRE